MGWQSQVAVILIPALLYAFLFLGQTFPKSHAEGASATGNNFKAMLNPLYLFMLVCMALTAISEFGPEQWIGPILGKAGASPMTILALVTGLMAVGRYFAGPIVERINSTGVLWGSAIMATIGIVMMSQATGSMVYVSAVIFAIGVCYFWPTMIGFVAENIPSVGALGLSLLGGMGMFATSIFQPVIGKWIKSEKEIATAKGLVGDAAELAAGQATLDNMAVFPAILIVAFGILFFFMRNKKSVGIKAH
jgi:putative MFS transporter